jgi:DNA polymerase III alpha subunit
LGEADMLRRGMSGKFRSREEFSKVKNQFFENCKNQGHNYELTSEIWRQIESFAGYAFAKGHSASYAVESYQSLFLKAYYPLEYLVATLNNFGGFYQPEYYVHEARMNGGIIHPPTINKSFYQNHIEGNDIYLGFMMLDSFEIKNATKIVNERNKNGFFLDLDDFIERVAISLEQLSILIKINAFQFTGRNKRELLWEAYMKVNKVCLEEHVSTLFKSEKIVYNTPQLSCSRFEDAFDEIQYLGFPLCSPFDLLTQAIYQQLVASDLVHYIGKTVTVYGYYVTAKRVNTSKGDLMYFGNFVDVKGDHIDTVHFPPAAKKYPFKGRGVYQLTGKVTEEFDCITIEIEKMGKLAIIQDPRYADTTKDVIV